MLYRFSFQTGAMPFRTHWHIARPVDFGLVVGVALTNYDGDPLCNSLSSTAEVVNHYVPSELIGIRIEGPTSINARHLVDEVH